MIKRGLSIVNTIISVAAILAAFSFAISFKIPQAKNFGLGVLAAMSHFAMLSGSTKGGVSSYIVRSLLLILSIYWAFHYLGKGFWFFIAGLFFVKIIIIVGFALNILVVKREDK